MLVQRCMKAGIEALEVLYEFLSILLTSFALNLIPFFSPSNLLIASNAALLTKADPFAIGFVVAFGSASAKFIHYMISFFVGGHLREKQKERFDATAPKVKRWAFLALFVAAATPIPDEPVVIPLGLLKYSPLKFYLAFFTGKLSITIVGAFLGRAGQEFLAPLMNEEILMVISIILTILVTILLLKIDVEKIAHKVLKRKAKPS